MNRTTLTFFTFALTLAACGDDKGTTTTSESAGSSSTADATTGTPGSGTSTGDVDPNPTSSTGNVDPNTTTTADPSTTTTTGDPDPTTTTADPSATATTTTAPDTGMETGGDLEMCLGMVDPGDACGECACNNCLAELHDCQTDEGCTAIRMCAQEAMCGGIDCLGPCGDTINMYGGLGGPSAQKALTLSGCVDDNCPGLCS